jgi:NADH-quinone oxidoreductase subunit N
MIQTGLQAFLPAVIVSLGSVVLMMQIAFWRRSNVSFLITCATLALAAWAVIPASEISPQVVTPLLLADNYGLFFTALMALAGLVTVMTSRDYLEHRRGENEEFYLLLLLATLGAMVLVSATHLASFLLGLELLGVSLYPLIAYPERGNLPLEAAVKYLVLSGAASAILLFGFALIYAALGTLSFSGIGEALAADAGADGGSQRLLILAGAAMAFVGIGFKLSVVPFHMWTPDVYQGAPSPVTGFLATVSKGAVFVALMRLYLDAGLYQYRGLVVAISVMAIASMLVGNLLALMQENVKRMLAYSSIAHLGYLLITLVVCSALGGGQLAIEAAGYYLVAYIATSLAAFAVVSIVSSGEAPVERDNLSAYRGLFWRSPWLATLFTVALLSLAGIPLTAGFIGKFYLFTAGVEGGLWVLLGTLVIGSAIGIYYYLRVVYTMALSESDDSGSVESGLAVHRTPLSMFVVLALILTVLLLGIYPQTVIDYLGGVVSQGL